MIDFERTIEGSDVACLQCHQPQVLEAAVPGTIAVQISLVKSHFVS